MEGLIGKKVGMTQVFDADGKRSCVTVIECGPCSVVQLKTLEKDGYVAAQVAAARAQTSVYPETYPLSGPTTLKSRPEWFTSPYTGGDIDTNLAVQETGDVAHNKLS